MSTDAAGQTPEWFKEGGNAGQESASEEDGVELPVEDDNTDDVPDKVFPPEPQPTEPEPKEEKPSRPKVELPRASANKRRSPSWGKVPQGVRFPRGIEVFFVKIPASMTMYPGRGDRQCIVWAMTDGDMKLAASRSMGNAARNSIELCKQFIRAADGQTINWTGDPSQPGIDIDTFWHEIGPKGRLLVERVYVKVNMVNEQEFADFFEHCIEPVRTG